MHKTAIGHFLSICRKQLLTYMTFCLNFWLRTVELWPSSCSSCCVSSGVLTAVKWVSVLSQILGSCSLQDTWPVWSSLLHWKSSYKDSFFNSGASRRSSVCPLRLWSLWCTTHSSTWPWPHLSRDNNDHDHHHNDFFC